MRKGRVEKVKKWDLTVLGKIEAA